MMKTCPACPTPAACKKAGKCLNAKPTQAPSMDATYKSSGGTVFKGR